ncbi:DUF3050 domain-containing protein [Pontibacter cellulosilyticus]|uniref:DUF3050 domain-containing protein n=1 Tax=Pontibacter cellulosilyticus TaxID=1720253 RepID=A0A923N6S6_9BACT|nr:DUF3050 domain-containing protein [Pontibacter cellulosilyticus]MBC5993258.1 DUF3050 domain-containing protein [Pontibacter cellulosilyticus]
MNHRIEALQEALLQHRQRLLEHNVYQSLETLEDLKTFMQHHVFAVWDFMSLLKGLQRDLTCVTLPWVPKGSPVTRRLINEIVLEEETDVDQEGNPVSHFELYLRAMEECGADKTQINSMLKSIAEGMSVSSALDHILVDASVKHFVRNTFSIIKSGKTHALAAAFTFGREDLIPDMFRNLIADLNERFPGKLDTFIYYLDRHVQLDEEVHTPLALQMVSELCGDDDEKWQEALDISIACIEQRIALWDGIRSILPTEAS